MTSPKFDIVVYGATGFTGQLVAEYLELQYRGDASLRWAMAGRSKDKLAAVRDTIGASDDLPLIVADSSDPASIRAMVDQAKLVLTTVGPYQLYGGDLLAACVAAGADYVDLCGEPVWMHQMIGQYQAEAEKSGARLLFSCGFDSVPFELGVLFLQEHARRALGSAAPRVKGRIRGMSGSLSGGTAASAKATAAVLTADLSLVAIMKDPFALTPGFKGPKQPPANRPLFEEDFQSWAAPFAMALVNTRNVHRSNMLMGFPYGQDFVYDEMVLTGDGEQGQANAKLVMAANAEKTGPNAPKVGEGPPKEMRDNGYFDLLCVAVSPDGRRVRTSVKGKGDPGYGLTAKMISECAVSLLRDGAGVKGGFWTPGAALGDSLIKRLVDNAGLTFAVED
ncbi:MULTISPECIES: saccharopine dehydrogenase family protein [unclassified Bradyrhizobium]|uniref:saccharopine dehydrogenase family protein n=1 Tax=unclassified Bradyrhizobium TaxID=2631580 RepID=UPI002916E189|nr:MULTISPECIES: saccharopine dehydrogenase NADP-binding domain-containing protein [unclassified Bradyrhizobium]